MGALSESNPISFPDRVLALEKAVTADEILYAALLGSPLGSDVYVDPSNGTDQAANGGSWTAPLKTFAYAVAHKVTDFTRLHFYGTVSEDSIVITNQGVKIIGEGPRGTNVWQNSTADASLITLSGAGCRLINFKVRPPIYSASIPKGIVLSGANYAKFIGMQFQGRGGSWYAVYSDVTSDDVEIIDTEFLYMNTASHGYAIYGVPSVAGATHAAWKIMRCLFEGCLNNYVAPSKSCLIQDCVMPDVGLSSTGGSLTCALKIDVHGTNAAFNQVHRNILGGAALNNANGYYGVSTDDWSGNIIHDGSITAVTPPTT